MQDFALSLYVLKLTGSATKFASVLAVTILPQIILGPICGVFADWFDRKKLLVVLDVISGLITISMALVLKLNGSLSMGYIYAAVISLSIVGLLYNSASGAIIPSLVEQDKLLEANSMNSTAFSLSQIVSPMLSGVLYGMFGIFVVIIINSVSFFISALSKFFMDILKSKRENVNLNLSQFKTDFKEGLIFIKNKKMVLKITICAFIINFAADPVFNVGMTYVGKKILLVSDTTMGMLYSVVSIGAIAGSVLSGFVGKKFQLSTVFGYGIIVTAILIGLNGITLNAFYNKLILNVPLVLVLIGLTFVLMMVVVIIINVMISTMFQRETPREMLGRVGSVVGTACTCAMPIGQMLIGGMFDYSKAYIPVYISAAIILLTGISFTVSERKNKSNITTVES